MFNVKIGVKNLLRKKGRTTALLLLIALAVGITLAMLQASSAVGERVHALSSQFETLIEIRAAGATGMGRGVQPITEGLADRIQEAKLPQVQAIEKVLYVRIVDNTRKYPVSVVAGVEPGKTLRVNSHGEVGTPTIIEGRNLQPSDQGNPVAVVGKVYAEQRGIELNDQFNLGGTTLKAIGLFDAGFTFGNNQVFVPLAVAQQIGRQLFPEEVDEGTISKVFLQVDSVENVAAVTRTLRADVLAQAEVDILTGQQRVDVAAAALQDIQQNAVFASLFALVVAALLVLFTMVLATLERIREVGIQRAIGASRLDIVRQFMAESFAIALVGTLAGALVYAIAGPFLATRLLGLSAVNLTGIAGMGAQSAAGVISWGVTLETLGYALVAVVVLAAIGSLYPAYQGLKLLPAEAMRHV